MTTLLIADVKDGALLDTTRRALSCALQIGGPVHLLVVGKSESALAAASRLRVEKIIHASKVDEKSADETFAALVLELAKDYDALVGSGSSLAKGVLPRVAAALDVMQISDVTRVIGGKRFERPIYAGNALQVLESRDAKLVITVRTSTFEPAGEAQSPPAIEMCDWEETQPRTVMLEEMRSQSERPDLAAAKVIVSGGRGLQSSANFNQYIGPVADQLRAAIGASRAAVDAGYAPNDWQVGQTGKVVAPELYIAVGISGAIQHLAGMKDSKVIVAINKDDEAPIFQVADYGLVADLFKAMPELKTELAK